MCCKCVDYTQGHRQGERGGNWGTSTPQTRTFNRAFGKGKMRWKSPSQCKYPIGTPHNFFFLAMLLATHTC